MTEDEPAPRTYPSGVPCWISTEQPDVDAALAFYAGLFGWQFTEAMPPGAPGRYVVAARDGRDVAGIGLAPDEGTPTWDTYIAVDDADAATERLVGLGATVVSPPEDAGPGGRAAQLADPEGALFFLWQARRRLGAQLVNTPDTWNFSDLRTADEDAAEAFYGPGFGWRFADLGYATAVQVPGYGDHLESTVDPDIRIRQASAPEGFADVVASLAPLGEGELPHWHVAFTVADRDQSAALAESLGATVLAGGQTDWTRTATVRDPQGAVLTLSQFTPPDGMG